jgi:iron(III) transport system permease protein
LVVALILVFYGLIAYTSLVRALGADHTVTFEHYMHVFTGGMRAITDTLIIAGLTMLLGGFFAILLGFLVARFHFRGRRSLEFVAMLNYALPGTIVGIAYLIAFSNPPVALTGGVTILVACYTFRYSPTGTRATVALLQQVDRSIEEASASLGANRGRTFRRIILPLIVPAFVAGMAVLFIRAMTAISATIFLVSMRWSLVTVRILEGITNLELGQASAFSIVVIALVFAMVGITSVTLRRLHARQVGQVGALLGG